MIITTTISYNNPTVLKECIDRYYELCYDKPDYHVVLDNNYPLYKEELKEVFNYISKKYGCLIYNSGENLGIRKGSFYLFEQFSKIKEIQKDDVIIFYDSNSYPLTKNFDKALNEILQNSEIGICCLTEKKEKNLEIIIDPIFNYKYTYNNLSNEASAICSIPYRTHLLTLCNYNMFSDTYGDGANYELIENILKNNNLKLAYLLDYKEDNDYFNNKEDLKYIQYKNFLLKIKPKDYISFDSYLKLNYEYKGDSTNINKEIFLFTGE